MDNAAELAEDDVQAALASLKDRMGALLGRSLVRLALYGSRARGDADPDSDVDVAIIVRGLDPALKERILSVGRDSRRCRSPAYRPGNAYPA